MARRIVGAVVGIVAALAVVALIEMLDVRLFPIAAGVDLDDPRAVEALIAAMPVAALAMVAAGWFLGALVGGIVAIALARRRARRGCRRWRCWRGASSTS